MTKSTITREPITHDLKIYPEFFSAVCTGVKRAELRKNDRDYRVGDTLHLMETPRGSCHQTGEFINVKITHIADVGEWMPGFVMLSIELQECRKADSEPAAYTDERNMGYIDRGRETAYLWGKQNSESSDVALYRHAQPAPVVPEEMKIPTIDEWENKSVFMEMFGRATGWNAFRAAMLQAGSSPAQNQGWIPVSERMPEIGVKVLCFPVKDEPIHATFDGKLWLQDVSWSGSDNPIDNVIPVSVTHWMPLPYAPQEVK